MDGVSHLSIRPGRGLAANGHLSVRAVRAHILSNRGRSGSGNRRDSSAHPTILRKPNFLDLLHLPARRVKPHVNIPSLHT